MINKEWCINELKLRMKYYEDDIEKLKKEHEEVKNDTEKYDADYVGVHSIKTQHDIGRDIRELNTCKFVESIIENWPEDNSIRDDMVYEMLEVLNHQYPISFLKDINETPEEWVKGEGEHNRGVNKRYNMLTFNEGHYTDWSRLRIYNLLDDSQVSRRKLNKIFGEDIGKEVYTRLMTFLDDTKPVIFPYYPQGNKWTMYCEIINEGDVKTIAICYIHKDGEKSNPEKIMRYFDICESGAFDEIDQTTYVNERRKKYEKRHAVEEVTDDEIIKEHEAQIKAAKEITEKGITDPAEKADILNAARKEVNNDEDNA